MCLCNLQKQAEFDPRAELTRGAEFGLQAEFDPGTQITSNTSRLLNIVQKLQ